jgi:hypothetical protein
MKRPDRYPWKLTSAPPNLHRKKWSTAGSSKRPCGATSRPTDGALLLPGEFPHPLLSVHGKVKLPAPAYRQAGGAFSRLARER